MAFSGGNLSAVALSRRATRWACLKRPFPSISLKVHFPLGVHGALLGRQIIAGVIPACQRPSGGDPDRSQIRRHPQIQGSSVIYPAKVAIKYRDPSQTWAATNGYYDITNASAGTNAGWGSPDNPDNHPVRNVSWCDVVKWCNARSQKEGRTPVYTVGGAIYSNSHYGPHRAAG